MLVVNAADHSSAASVAWLAYPPELQFIVHDLMAAACWHNKRLLPLAPADISSLAQRLSGTALARYVVGFTPA
jgi:hypothetical protein